MYFAIVGTMAMEAIVKAQADRITQNRRNMVYQGSDMMNDGDAVEVRLAGDDAWYKGVVLKPRKMWVQLENHPAGETIADESNIVEWRKV